MNPSREYEPLLKSEGEITHYSISKTNFYYKGMIFLWENGITCQRNPYDHVWIIKFDRFKIKEIDLQKKGVRKHPVINIHGNRRRWGHFELKLNSEKENSVWKDTLEKLLFNTES